MTGNEADFCSYWQSCYLALYGAASIREPYSDRVWRGIENERRGKTLRNEPSITLAPTSWPRMVHLGIEETLQLEILDFSVGRVPLAICFDITATSDPNAPRSFEFAPITAPSRSSLRVPIR
jgi:hypothetical protein